MSENNTPAKHSENNVAASEEREVNNNLETQYGTTTIDDVVVSKIAGIAAREVSGVDSLGGGGARMMGTIRESFGASEDVRQGVSVEVANGTASIDIAIIAEYGVAIHELAEAIRKNIIVSVEAMTGLEVTEVNIAVLDVHVAGDGSDDTSDARVE